MGRMQDLPNGVWGGGGGEAIQALAPGRWRPSLRHCPKPKRSAPMNLRYDNLLGFLPHAIIKRGNMTSNMSAFTFQVNVLIDL